MSFTNKLKNYKCRTCFEATTKGLKPLTNLATDEEEPPITYGEILRQLTNINIMEDKCPEITQLICGGCSRKLKSAYAFVQQAQEVNKELLSMIYRDDSGIKPMDCLQESQVDIESCLEIKIEPDDTLVEEGAGQFEVPPCDVKLKLNKSDEDILTNINAADMLDEVQIKLEDSEGNIIANTDEETTEKRHLKTSVMDYEFDGDSVETRSFGTPKSTNERLQKIEDAQMDMQNKLSIILDNQAKILSVLTQYSKKNNGAVQIFPIKTTEGIKKANDLIRVSDENYVSIIRDIIFPGTLKENFHRLFATELLLNYNFDGVSDKNSLKEFKFLIDAIFDATKKDGYTYKEFKNEMRQAIKISKNRHFKKQYDLKKKNCAS